MGYNIMFMVNRSDIARNNMAPIFSSYEWWLELAKKALETADKFEMRLWEEDQAGIKSGQRFGSQVPNTITREIVFVGKITPEFKREVLTNFLTEEGYIKWFTLNLKRDNKNIFSSSHYGDETYICVNTKEQVDAALKWAQKHPTIWRVDVFEC